MASVYHGLHDYSTFSASTIPPANNNHFLDDEPSQCVKCCCCLCRYSSRLILHPVGPFRCIWDMFVMILLVYTSIEIPYTMAFGLTSTLQYVGLFVDGFLFIDIILNFHTAYFDKYDNLRLVTKKTYICKKYFRTWFLIDFLTCVPFEFIFSDPNAASGALKYLKILRIFRLLRIIKILRFIKMLRIFDAFMKQFIVREVLVFMKLFKIIFGMLMFAHFAACLWWFVGSRTESSWIDVQDVNLRSSEHVTSFQQYSYAWYWAVVTLFTTGYGDIVATNTLEQWVCSICILIGTCFFAYFVGTLTVLITEGDKIKAYESEKLEEAQSFCEKKKLPKELTRAVLTHIRYHCTYNFIFDEGELLNILPAYLQHDIHTYVSKQFLLDLSIFQNEYIHLSEFIVGLIAVKTKSISCNQMFKLYDIGDMAKEFYIQRTGKSIMYDKQNRVLQHLSRGSVCGEYSSILFKRRKLKVQCKTWSEFYSINIDDIKDVLNQYYPKSAHTKWKQIKKYIKHSYKRNRRHSVELGGYGIDYLQASPSLHSIPRATKLSMQRSNSYGTNRVYSNESIHLFNNTRDLSVNSAEKDLVETINNTENEKNQEANKSMSRTVIVTKDNHIIPQSPVKIIKSPSAASQSTSALKKYTKPKEPRRTSSGTFAKFKLRSNSEIRNQVIVEHTKKHDQSTAVKKSKKTSSFRNLFVIRRASTLSKSGLQENKIQSVPNIFKKANSTNEMTTVNTCAATVTYDTGCDYNIDKRQSTSIRSAYSAISVYEDSECSLSSIDSDHESSNNEDKQLQLAQNANLPDMQPELHNNKTRGSNSIPKPNVKTKKVPKRRRRRKTRAKLGGVFAAGKRSGPMHSLRLRKAPNSNTINIVSSENTDTDGINEDSVTNHRYATSSPLSPDSYDLLAPLQKRIARNNDTNIGNDTSTRRCKDSSADESGNSQQDNKQREAQHKPVLNSYVEYKKIENGNECSKYK